MPRTRLVERPVDRLVVIPFERWAHDAKAASLLLLAATVVALLWANAAAAPAYDALWQRPLAISIGDFTLSLTLREWVNDALMALFFLVVGLEIERELFVGSLSSWRAALLPAAGALGGMLVPAALYLLVAGDTADRVGWGVPMATDIAFALGLLALIAPGVPTGLRAFLAALAIVDDLGAIGVIALFYSSGSTASALTWVVVLIAALLVANRMGVRDPAPYLVLGVPLWLALHAAHIHASLVGVLLAFAIPARTRVDADTFLTVTDRALGVFRLHAAAGRDSYADEQQQEALDDIGQAYREAQSPSVRVLRALHPFVALVVLPLFALANAGVPIGELSSETVMTPATVGIVVGLLIGKPVGITACVWLVLRLRLADLPAGVFSIRAVAAVSTLAGIGFTMAIFVATLAFGESIALQQAKLAILSASLLAATVGAFALRGYNTPHRREDEAVPGAQNAD
jgi:Na+:H+ antiporter, NhaA family